MERVASAHTRRRRFVCALALVATGVAITPVARATGEPTTGNDTSPAAIGTPLDPAAPRVAIELHRDDMKIETTERQLAVVRARLASSATDDELTAEQIRSNRLQLDLVQQRLRTEALLVYQRTVVPKDALAANPTSDAARGRRYLSAALDADETDLRKLSAVEQALESRQTDHQARTADLQRQETDLLSTEDALGKERARDDALLAMWGAVPVMGDPALTEGQLTAWFQSTGVVARLAPGTTIADLAHLYVVEGRAEHVRGDLAFAQAVIETGSFQVAAGNNYSGIGVCDSCRGGYAFPTPLDGVRAQIQLLRNYADPDSRAALLANPPSPALYGDNARKAGSRYDTFFLKGKAPLWNQMGNGNWATDPTYAGKVLGVYGQMLTFAAAHPG